MVVGDGWADQPRLTAQASHACTVNKQLDVPLQAAIYLWVIVSASLVI